MNTFITLAYTQDEINELQEKLSKLETTEEKEKLLERDYTQAYIYLLQKSGRKYTPEESNIDEYTLFVWETMNKNGTITKENIKIEDVGHGIRVGTWKNGKRYGK